MTMVRAPGSVLMHRASELRHADQCDVLGLVSHIRPERRNRLAELLQPAGKLSIHATLILVRVPSPDIGKSSFDSQVRLQKLGHLLQAVSKSPVGIVGA